MELPALIHKHLFFPLKVKHSLELNDGWLGHYFYFQQVHRRKSVEVIRKGQKCQVDIKSFKNCSSVGHLGGPEG